MQYVIVFAPEAIEDLNQLKANIRSNVTDAIGRHLRHEPTKVSKSRIKRLQGLSHPQYRLRVGDDVRVFYDVDVENETVEVLAVVSKAEAVDWLNRYGENDEKSSSI